MSAPRRRRAWIARATPRALVGLLAAACLALGGCAVGPDFRRPAAPAVSGYLPSEPSPTPAVDTAGGASQRFLPGATVPERWWSVFGCEGLDAAVQQALAHNPGIEAAAASLRQARELESAQYAQYFPGVSAAYSPSRQRNPVGTLAPTLASGDPVYTLHTAQLNVGFVPDVFGLNRRSVESLQAQREVQYHQLRAVALTVAANMATAAIQDAALRAQLAAARDLVATGERMLAVLRRQSALGFASGLDVAAQESALAQARQVIPPLEKQLAQNADLMAVLGGDAPAAAAQRRFELDELHLPEELPLSLPAQLVRQRPDVMAAEATLHSATAQVGVAVANRMPQFSLSAQYGGTATQLGQLFTSANQFWVLAGSATQTLVDFGALEHRQHAAEAGVEQAAAQYLASVLTAFQNVADVLVALDTDARALQAASEAAAAAGRTLELTRHQLALGAVGGLAVASAQQGELQARMTLVQARAARLSDSVALFQALGGPADVFKLQPRW